MIADKDGRVNTGTACLFSALGAEFCALQVLARVELDFSTLKFCKCSRPSAPSGCTFPAAFTGLARLRLEPVGPLISRAARAARRHRRVMR